MNHGKLWTYNKHKCRCEECREANNQKQKRDTIARMSRRTPDHVHGSANGYKNYGCRCPGCSQAAATEYRAYYLKNKP